MPLALWRTALLTSFLCFCVCLEQDCVLGIVGRPVLLPCFYPDLSNFANLSIEWTRDDKTVLRAEWDEDGNVLEWSINHATISADAVLTGNLSLELPMVHPQQDKSYYSLFLVSGGNQSAPLCTTCLRIAASFRSPLLQREDAKQGGETAFFCHSSGGFPEPSVYWLINDTEEPPEGSVRTQAASLPDTHLYNVTSHLTVNISKDSSVSCIIENLSMNQTLTSTSYGAQGSRVVKRASQAMWIFSTGLCVVVGVMVLAGVGYQIHLDRISKRKKKEFQRQQQQQHLSRGHKRRAPYEETEVMTLERTETDV